MRTELLRSSWREATRSTAPQIRRLAVAGAVWLVGWYVFPMTPDAAWPRLPLLSLHFAAMVYCSYTAGRIVSAFLVELMMRLPLPTRMPERIPPEALGWYFALPVLLFVPAKAVLGLVPSLDYAFSPLGLHGIAGAVCAVLALGLVYIATRLREPPLTLLGLFVPTAVMVIADAPVGRFMTLTLWVAAISAWYPVWRVALHLRRLSAEALPVEQPDGVATAPPAA
jgi:hypothetical protein